MRKDHRDPLTEQIIACCFKVHNELGPGFNEKIYHRALLKALAEAGLKYESEKTLTVKFMDDTVGTFRCDVLVEGKVVVELKALKGQFPPIFIRNLISYLKASGKKTGLLVNFGNVRVNIKRLAN